MKILIIRLSAIGDLVMTTPVIRCLKKGIEGAELHLLTNPSYTGVLAHNPYLAAIHALKGEAVLEQLKQQAFDVVIDLQGNEQSRAVASFLHTKTYTVRQHSFRKFLFTNLKWNVMPGDHQVERFLQTIAPLSISNDGGGLDYFVPKEEEVPQHDIPTSHQLGYIALVIGASKWNKKLPAEHLQEICRRIDHPIILMGDASEQTTGEWIRSVDNIKIYNACGKFSLHESADLLRKAKLVVTHDTGLMHMAAAFQKPIITIWGSTTPSLGVGPYYGRTPHPKAVNFHVQVEKLWCRPCSTDGLNSCPQGHFKCMKKIEVSEVVSRVEELLRGK